MINIEFDSILQIINDNGFFDIHTVSPIHRTKLYVIRCFHLKDNIVGQHE